MKFFGPTIAIGAALTLAACGGSSSGGEDPVQGVDFEISEGVISDIEIPTDAQIAQLPNEIQNVVNQFVSANENEILTPTLPMGEALFVGPWAAGSTGDSDALVGGTMSIEVDFDAGDEFLNGRLDVNYVFGEDGEALAVTRNPLEEDGFDVDVNGVIEDGGIAGTLNGRFNVEDDPILFGGSIEGSFTGEGATGAIGTISASVGFADGGEDGFDGLFQLDRTVPD